MSKPKDTTPLKGYEAVKERARDRAAELARTGRDIGELPKVVNPDLREACRLDLRLFLESYFADRFRLAWSLDHLRAIAKIQTTAIDGGLFALAMPRGSGKTSLLEAATVWVLVYGHRSFVVLVGADAGSATNSLESIKSALETNDTLAGDFPEVCHPIRALERIAQRAKGQLFEGSPTHIGWTGDAIVLPTIPGAKSSGATVRVAGITGRIRGMKHTRADGTSIRPDCVLIDDPQTEESARSVTQCRDRIKTINGAILGLAGPGQSIAGFAAVTVIERGDAADQVLDPKTSPQWKGERMKLIYSWPDREDLWRLYCDLRREDVAESPCGTRARDHYAKHREAMDAGAVVAWPERKLEDDLSAIQHAYNLRVERGEDAFQSEFQNDPIDHEAENTDTLKPAELKTRLSGLDVAVMPLSTTRLTAMVDVQEESLWYAVCAWGEDFSGSVIAYGTWPAQTDRYYTLRDMRETLSRKYPGMGLEARLRSGLIELTDDLCSRAWRREDGLEARIARCLIDAQWGISTDVVHEVCRVSTHASVLTPRAGRGIKASDAPIERWAVKVGERRGPGWIITGGQKRGTAPVMMDTNFWKTFVAARMRTAIGDRGALSFFGRLGAQATLHDMLVDHICSERPTRVEAKGRVVDEWSSPVAGRDNHWWDCVVGCATAASIEGVRLFDQTGGVVEVRQRVKFSERMNRSRK
jgi:hypothetical protein